MGLYEIMSVKFENCKVYYRIEIKYLNSIKKKSKTEGIIITLTTYNEMQSAKIESLCYTPEISTIL